MTRIPIALALAAALAPATAAQIELIPAPSAETLLDLVPIADHARLEADVDDAGGATHVTLTTTPVRSAGTLLTWTVASSESAMLAAPWSPPVFLPAPGTGPQVVSGTIPPHLSFEDDLSLYLRNLLVEDDLVVGTNVVEIPLGFSECVDVDFAALAAGTIVGGQFPGLTISADNANPTGPDTAIIFDSSTPTGEDGDLVTPGYGLNNAIARRGVLVIAEDVVDVVGGDGLVDDPDDEGWGGTLRFDFASPVTLVEIGILDQDVGESLELRFGTADGGELAFSDLPAGGDNSISNYVIVDQELVGLIWMEVVLGGSGAVAHLSYCLPLQAD